MPEKKKAPAMPNGMDDEMYLMIKDRPKKVFPGQTETYPERSVPECQRRRPVVKDLAFKETLPFAMDTSLFPKTN
jgi:hypothetical protein